MHLDIHATRDALNSVRISLGDIWDQCLDIATSPRCAQTFTALTPPTPQQLRTPHPGWLNGLPVSVKDLFDVSGQVTRAGSIALDQAPVAQTDAPTVARLRQAGGLLMGRTNMVEFAFSGVGINPHYGTPAAWDGRHDCAVRSTDLAPSLPGGSSSGAAVSVASGAAYVGLGSDTGGSIRIPAALNGIVGFKSTAELVPTNGAIPLSTTLDTACALTRSVRDAAQVHNILSGQAVVTDHRPWSQRRLAVVTNLFLDELDPQVHLAFFRAVSALSAAGATVQDIQLPPLNDLPELMLGGGFSAIESFAWHRKLLARCADLYDPRVRQRIERGGQAMAWEYIALHQRRRQWIQEMRKALEEFDAVLSPTVPMAAPSYPRVAPGPERDAAFFNLNAQLLRNTSVVNLLDGCALSMPCHQAGEPPVGLMLWHGAHHDVQILNIGRKAEEALLF